MGQTYDADEVRALAESFLEMDDTADGTLSCRVNHRGHVCRDSTAQFESVVHAVLRREEDGRWRIVDLSIAPNEDSPAWKATCIHMSSTGPDMDRLTKNSPAKGLLLDEFLSREWPVQDAGCFCTSIHVMHKVLLTMHAIRLRLEEYTPDSAPGRS